MGEFYFSTRQIESLLAQIESAENAGRPEPIIDLLADDAVIMAPNEPVQAGKAMCAEFVTRVIEDQRDHFDRHITYVSDEVRALGDHAFDRGTFWFTVARKSGGDSSRETGKYFFLYSRAADAWKLFRAIVSLDAQDEPA